MPKAVKAAGNETRQLRWEDCIKKDTGMAEVKWKERIWSREGSQSNDRTGNIRK